MSMYRKKSAPAKAFRFSMKSTLSMITSLPDWFKKLPGFGSRSWNPQGKYVIFPTDYGMIKVHEGDWVISREPEAVGVIVMTDDAFKEMYEEVPDDNVTTQDPVVKELKDLIVKCDNQGTVVIFGHDISKLAEEAANTINRAMLNRKAAKDIAQELALDLDSMTKHRDELLTRTRNIQDDLNARTTERNGARTIAKIMEGQRNTAWAAVKDAVKGRDDATAEMHRLEEELEHTTKSWAKATIRAEKAEAALAAQNERPVILQEEQIRSWAWGILHKT